MRIPNAPNPKLLCFAFLLATAQVFAGQSYKMPQYWPLENGRVMEYRHEKSGDTFEVQAKITGPVRWGERQAFRVENSLGDESQRFYWNWDKGYLSSYGFQRSNGAWVRNTDPCEVLPEELPVNARDMRVGNGSRYEGDAGEGYNRPYYVTCIGVENVTVPAGDFEALHLELQQVWPDENGGVRSYSTDLYLAKGVGVVRRYDSRHSMLTVLMRYSDDVTVGSAPPESALSFAPPQPVVTLQPSPVLDRAVIAQPFPALTPAQIESLESEDHEKHGFVWKFFNVHSDWPMWKRVTYWATIGH